MPHVSVHNRQHQRVRAHQHTGKHDICHELRAVVGDEGSLTKAKAEP
jgi:hypothetical protein